MLPKIHLMYPYRSILTFSTVIDQSIRNPPTVSLNLNFSHARFILHTENATVESLPLINLDTFHAYVSVKSYIVLHSTPDRIAL